MMYAGVHACVCVCLCVCVCVCMCVRVCLLMTHIVVSSKMTAGLRTLYTIIVIGCIEVTMYTRYPLHPLMYLVSTC